MLHQAMDALSARYGRNTVSIFSSSAPKPCHAPGKNVALLHHEVE